MAISYKIDVLDALKDRGYSAYRIRQEKIFNQYTLQRLRQGEPISWTSLDRICSILRCQPGDLLEYRDDPGESGRRET